MSFRQIFDRINRIARANISGDGASGDYQESLRRARELIEESRRRDRKEPEPDPSSESAGESESSGAERMNRAAACAVLGVSVGATMEEITKAYRVRIVTVHPDRLVGADIAVIEQAKRKTQELNDAYSFLKRTSRGG